MGNPELARKLGVELISVMKGCCVDTIAAWRPSCVGERTKCMYCENSMKAIRAQEIYHSEFGEKTLADRDVPENTFIPSSLWFSMKHFASADAVKGWCENHDITYKSIEEHDAYCYRVKLADVDGDSDRVIWADRGVLASFGLNKVATSSLLSGGMLNPSQGASADLTDKAPQKVSPFYPISGTTEEADGHSHSYSLEPDTASHGTIGVGKTSVFNEHNHEINIQVSPQGVVDGTTNPSQSTVGGHAHKHRILNAQKEAPGGAAGILSAFEMRLGKLVKPLNGKK